MLEEEKKHTWLKIVSIILVSFIAAFLAFYCALEVMIHRMADPMYNARRIEKMMVQQERNFKRMEDKMMENPFEPKMRPMLVNLVEEGNEYKIIVDLKPLRGNDKNINVKVDDGVVTVSGESDRKTLGGEKILNFSQAYMLDKKLDTDKMTKEKKGDKYIITIPFSE